VATRYLNSTAKLFKTERDGFQTKKTRENQTILKRRKYNEVNETIDNLILKCKVSTLINAGRNRELSKKVLDKVISELDDHKQWNIETIPDYPLYEPDDDPYRLYFDGKGCPDKECFFCNNFAERNNVPDLKKVHFWNKLVLQYLGRGKDILRHPTSLRYMLPCFLRFGHSLGIISFSSRDPSAQQIIMALWCLAWHAEKVTGQKIGRKLYDSSQDWLFAAIQGRIYGQTWGYRTGVWHHVEQKKDQLGKVLITFDRDHYANLMKESFVHPLETEDAKSVEGMLQRIVEKFKPPVVNSYEHFHDHYKYASD